MTQPLQSFNGQGNIVRSLDLTAQKEYTYTYEEGRLARAAESNITLSGEIVTQKHLVNSIRYTYSIKTNAIENLVTFAKQSGVAISSRNVSGKYSY